MNVTLINLNTVSVPAIAPYAIDVLGSALSDAGHDVDVLDLCRHAEDPVAAVHERLSASAPGLVGLSMRNAVDLYMPSLFDLPEHGSFLSSHRRVVDAVRTHVDPERILVGGVGFSVNPPAFLERLGLRYGVRGPGERVICEAAARLDRGTLRDLAGGAERFVFDGGARTPLTRVCRTYVDNVWYYENGGQAAFRTTSGCAMRCSYCAEPVAIGASYRRAQLENVLCELDELVAMGVHDLQTADSEFNMPLGHCKDVLRGIIARRYGKEVRFWAYSQPRPFDEEYASLLAEAGFVGINLGSDHTEDDVLTSLGKWYSWKHIEQATRWCQAHGLAVMHELLIGAPGDTPAKMYTAIERLRALEPWALGVSVGLTVLPGTPLGGLLEERRRSGDVAGFYFAGEAFVDPTFYVDPAFTLPDLFDDLSARFSSDRRIMLPSLASKTSVNNQLVNSDRVRHQLLVERRKGPSWFHYPDRTF